MAALEVYIRRSYLAYNVKSMNVRSMIRGQYVTADWVFFMPVWHPSLQVPMPQCCTSSIIYDSIRINCWSSKHRRSTTCTRVSNNCH
jgi:hypothetical protein